MSSTVETCWPSPLQETLLRAALLDGEAALHAWRQWRAEVDLDHVDPESYRVLAPLSANLRSLGVDEPLASLLKGVRRQTWAANHRLMKAAMTPLRQLDAAGIPLLLLKGAALVLVYYRDFGMRAFADVDVLVPTERARDAIALLEGSGWAPVFYGRRQSVTDSDLLLQHGIGVRNADGMVLDLHWHVMRETCRAGADEPFWRASQTVEVDGLPVRVLAPTDQLLHAFADGLRLEDESKIRWTADALAILRTPGACVEWPRMIAMAQQLRLVPVVREALAYLDDRLAAPIPPEVITALAALPTTRTDRMDYRLRTTAHDLGFLNVLRRMWLWHRRLSDSPDAIRLLGSFPRFLQRYYEIDSPWRLSVHAARRAMRRLRRVGLV